MSKKINLTIPQPCHESWEAMSPTDKGRFCASCQKNVVDFTKASDRQIAEVYSKDKTTCGLFLDTQLNRDLIIYKEKNRFWAAASAAAISFFALGTGQALAQGEPIVKEKSTIPAGVENKTYVLTHTITGTVVNKYNRPVKGVKITLKNSILETVTDANGEFAIEAAEGEILKFTGDNLKTQKITVTGETEYNVALRFRKEPKMPPRIMGRLF
jgi:hypothetical protein